MCLTCFNQGLSLPSNVMTDHEIEQPEQPSKSQRKRDAHDLQKLGEQLVQLDDTRLREFDLPDRLYDAIVAARKIRQHGARKRQLQFIGKLMRSIDTVPIETRLANLNQQHQHQTEDFHHIEQWRDRLIQDDQSLAELIDQHPEVDRQHLRQLIRNARTEQKQNKAPRSARSLFRYLRETLPEDAPPKDTHPEET